MKNKNDYLKVDSKIKYFLFLIIFVCLYPISKLLYGSKKKWLVCERGNDAQDNGFVFFRYLIEKHKDITPVFVIRRDSPDYERVNKIGKTVEPLTLKHLMMAIGCKVKISSHLYGYCPWKNFAIFLRRHKSNDVHVFLQHGITKNMHNSFLSEINPSLKILICGSYFEFLSFKNDFHYSEDVVKYTGFPRFDYLNNNDVSNVILIMPTWRSYLSNLSIEEFKTTDFVLKWNEFLRSNELKNMCLNNNIIVKFYLHYSFQKYSAIFESNDFIKVIYFGNEPVQKLLLESKILITDFSSVFFDFAYLYKPLIYYQFDENAYYSSHYEKGYFSYRNDGFGDVCTDCQMLINSLKGILNRNFNMEDKYKKRVSSTFKVHDFNNCTRVYNEIIKLI